jgi:hypothetical protein
MKNLNSPYSLIHKVALGLGLTALIFTASCTTELEPTTGINEADVEADLIAQADFEEVDDMTSNAMSFSDGGSGGRVEGNGMNDDRMKCAIVTHDHENQVITIDFGEGCEGPNGVTRSGIIIINYDGRRFIPGSSWVISFDNFYVNDRLIEGVRTVTNISESIEADPKFHILLEGGKVTWPDETFATREVDRVRVWIRESNPMLDEYHILAESTVTGTNRENLSYSCVVASDLVILRACRGEKGGRIPVSGVKDVTIGDATYSVDFGDGECDSIVTITSGDDIKVVDLSDR